MLSLNNNSQVPTVGGHTNFRHAGVHVRPGPGTAVFFSYIDPKTNITDNGYASHSGCPVYEGSKRIVTQWMRLGVDEKNPFTAVNTLGVWDENYGKEDDSYDGYNSAKDNENKKSDKKKVSGMKRKGVYVNNIQVASNQDFLADQIYLDGEDEEEEEEEDDGDYYDYEEEAIQRSLKRRIVRARGSRVKTRPSRKKYGSDIESKVRGQQLLQDSF
jgi:hypothetical protein